MTVCTDGNVLAVYKTGETVRDRVTGENVKIPDRRSGLLMVFRTYDKLLLPGAAGDPLAVGEGQGPQPLN